jgi:hypothetical protein
MSHPSNDPQQLQFSGIADKLVGLALGVGLIRVIAPARARIQMLAV